MLFLEHPIFSALSFVATVRAFMIAKKYFPETNSNNGIGNAFRHALWCCLILMYCCKISSPQKAMCWCARVTDLHEELFPNQPLETKMDLHNNRVGMELFSSLLTGIHRQFFETSFFIDHLLALTKDAKVLLSINDKPGNHLVFLQQK